VKSLSSIGEPAHRVSRWVRLRRNNKFADVLQEVPKFHLQGCFIARVRRKLFRFGRRYGFLLGLVLSVPKVPDFFAFVMQLIGQGRADYEDAK
jgi:hypothetical protein